MTDVGALLGRTRLFRDLDAESRADVARQMRSRNYSPGQMIFSRGDPAADICLVAKGKVRISITSPEGRELCFSYFGEGEVFGEIAALDGSTRTTDATCIAPTTVFLLSRTGVNALFETSPAFSKAVVALLCDRLRDTDLQLEAIALHRIETRLARYCLMRIDQQAREAGTKPDASLELGLSQGDLAMLLGASRPRVNAAFMLLENCGALRRKGALFEYDLSELQRVAEHD